MLLSSPSRLVSCLLRVLFIFGVQKKIKNMANSDFENHKHLQNYGHLFLTANFMKRSGFCQKIRTKSVIDVHESSNFGSKSVKEWFHLAIAVSVGKSNHVYPPHIHLSWKYNKQGGYGLLLHQWQHIYFCPKEIHECQSIYSIDIIFYQQNITFHQ